MDKSRGRNAGGGTRTQWEWRTSWLRGTLIVLVWVQIMLAVIINKHLVVIQWLLLNEQVVSVLSSVKNCPSHIIKPTVGVAVSSGLICRAQGNQRAKEVLTAQDGLSVSGLAHGWGNVMWTSSSLVYVVEALLIMPLFRAGASYFPTALTSLLITEASWKVIEKT